MAEGRPFYEVVACIDGRGFRESREDIRQMLLRLNGKVFTMATPAQLITHTRIRKFASRPIWESLNVFGQAKICPQFGASLNTNIIAKSQYVYNIFFYRISFH